MKKTIALMLAALMLLSLTACGGKAEKKNVDLSALYQSYQPQLPEMFEMNADTMMNFLGIDAEKCAQAIVVSAADGLRADEIWLIEAKDAEALAKIQSLAQTRLVAKEDETIVYNPEQYAVVKKAHIVTSGLYLALLVSPEADAMKTAFENAVK